MYFVLVATGIAHIPLSADPVFPTRYLLNWRDCKFFPGKGRAERTKSRLPYCVIGEIPARGPG